MEEHYYTNALTLDLINDSITRQHTAIWQIVANIGPLRLSQDNIPVDFWETLLFDENMNTMVVHASTSGQELTPKIVKLNGSSGSNTNASVNTQTLKAEGNIGIGSIAKMEMPLISPDTKSPKLKAMRDKKPYRRAIKYCSQLVAEEELQLIKMKIKFVRKFERTYTNVALRESR